MLYSRFSDVETLVDHAARNLRVIADQYRRARERGRTTADLQINIKDYLQTLRSSLDYLAQEIPGFNRAYPMCRSADEIAKKMAKADRTSVAAVTKWQPFNQPWLQTFNWLNNEHKHQMLVPQQRVERLHATTVKPARPGYPPVVERLVSVEFYLSQKSASGHSVEHSGDAVPQ